MAYVKSFLHAIVVVAMEEAIHVLRLVATEQVNVPLHHMRWSPDLLSVGLPAGTREREREREREINQHSNKNTLELRTLL